MINRDCKTCALSAYCATVGADVILLRLRKCKHCSALSYLAPPDPDGIVVRKDIVVGCYGVVEAWMLRGAVEVAGCPGCGDTGVWKIAPSAVSDVVKECKEMEGFELDERMQAVPLECAVLPSGEEEVF